MRIRLRDCLLLVAALALPLAVAAPYARHWRTYQVVAFVEMNPNPGAIARQHDLVKISLEVETAEAAEAEAADVDRVASASALAGDARTLDRASLAPKLRLLDWLPQVGAACLASACLLGVWTNRFVAGKGGVSDWMQ